MYERRMRGFLLMACRWTSLNIIIRRHDPIYGNNDDYDCVDYLGPFSVARHVLFAVVLRSARVKQMDSMDDVTSNLRISIKYRVSMFGIPVNVVFGPHSDTNVKSFVNKFESSRPSCYLTESRYFIWVPIFETFVVLDRSGNCIHKKHVFSKFATNQLLRFTAIFGSKNWVEKRPSGGFFIHYPISIPHIPLDRWGNSLQHKLEQISNLSTFFIFINRISDTHKMTLRKFAKIKTFIFFLSSIDPFPSLRFVNETFYICVTVISIPDIRCVTPPL